MTPTGKTIIVFEMIGYGVLLNFGYPYDTVQVASIVAAVVAATWALDRFVEYIRQFKQRK